MHQSEMAQQIQTVVPWTNWDKRRIFIPILTIYHTLICWKLPEDFKYSSFEKEDPFSQVRFTVTVKIMSVFQVHNAENKPRGFDVLSPAHFKSRKMWDTKTRILHPLNEEEAWNQQELTHQDSVLRLVSFDLQFDSLPQWQLHLPPHCIPHALYTEQKTEEMK